MYITILTDERRNNIIISIEIEKAMDTTTSFSKLNENKLEIKENILKLTNGSYRKPTASIVFNYEIFKAFPLSLRKRQGYLLALFV